MSGPKAECNLFPLYSSDIPEVSWRNRSRLYIYIFSIHACLSDWVPSSQHSVASLTSHINFLMPPSREVILSVLFRFIFPSRRSNFHISCESAELSYVTDPSCRSYITWLSVKSFLRSLVFLSMLSRFRFSYTRPFLFSVDRKVVVAGACRVRPNRYAIAVTDHRQFNSAHMYALEEQRVRQRRRAEFYESVATRIFKSAAEIAFFETGNMRQRGDYASRKKPRSRFFLYV